MEARGPHQRLGVLLAHLSTGEESAAASAPSQLRREAASSGVLPSRLQPGDQLALCRLLDHDNHEMRDAMKRFMDADLFKPVRDRRPGAASARGKCRRSLLTSPSPALRRAAGCGA